MKLDAYWRILSIFISLVWITCVSSLSLPVEENTNFDTVTDSNGLLPVATESPKLQSKFKSAWKKNKKKPYFQKASQLKQLKTSEEQIDQEESKDFHQKSSIQMTNGSKSSLSAPPAPSPNKTQEILPCSNDNAEVQQVCENFCTQVKQFNLGFCSSDQETCVCAMEGEDMTTLRVKLYKPTREHNSLVEQDLKSNSQPEILVSKEDFGCDHSAYAESVCSAYCYQFRQLNNSKCSEDGKSCLCLSNVDQLNQTQPEDIIEKNTDSQSRSGRHFDLMHEVSEIFLGMGSHSDGHSNGMPVSVRGRSPLVPHPMPMVQPHRYCTHHMCINECPGYCQSMCMHSVDCYCSCPEDIFYEYDEYPIFG